MKPNPNKVAAFVLLGLVAIVLAVFAIRARTSDAIVGTWANNSTSVFGRPQTVMYTLDRDGSGVWAKSSSEPNGQGVDAPYALTNRIEWHKSNDEVVFTYELKGEQAQGGTQVAPTDVFKYRISDDGKMLWLTEGDQAAKVFRRQ